MCVARAPWKYSPAPLRPSQALPPLDRQAAAQLTEKKRVLAGRLFARTRVQDLLERDGAAKEAPAIEGLQLSLPSALVATLLELREELRPFAVTSAPLMVEATGMKGVYVKRQRPAGGRPRCVRTETLDVRPRADGRGAYVEPTGNVL
jgi:hypothetical protein